jgi:hypothetical protein
MQQYNADRNMKIIQEGETNVSKGQEIHNRINIAISSISKYFLKRQCTNFIERSSLLA